MIVLKNTTDTIGVVLGGAITTSQLSCFASYRDITTTTYKAGNSSTETNDTTSVTLVSAPATSTQRVVDYLSVFNSDTVTTTITVFYSDNGTEYELFKVSLATGKKLEYVDGYGFKTDVVSGGGGGATAFTDLTDVPASYAGESLKHVRVNVGETGLEFDALTKADVGLSNVDNTSDADKPVSTATQTALDLKVDENAAIVGATKTKITYDAKGLVTAGTDATTADIADSTDKRYVTDAQQTVITNTSGTNSGNETTSTIGSLINGASAATPNDTDLVGTAESSVLKKITWANVKAFLKTYFDTLYQAVGSYVTTARTLTINGTAYDLSADRSWTVTAGWTGIDATQTPLTGTGTETIMASILIPANTFAVGDGMRIESVLSKSAQTANDTWVVKIYLNNTNDLTTPIQILTTGTMGATTRTLGITRGTPLITGTTTMTSAITTSALTDDLGGTSTSAYDSVTIPSITSDMYLIVTAQHNGASQADTIQHRKTVIQKQW